jgi:M61 glycyl aminopeptidase
VARGSLAATALAGLGLIAPSASARTDVPALTKPQAIAAVRGVVRAKASACGLRIVRITATRSGRGWRVAAITSGRTSGVSRWSVTRKPAPLNPLARRIVSGCPHAKPPQVPTEPPPLAPGAPATYTFGSGVTPAQQELVRRGLDAGARLYRSALGRELPELRAWAYANLDELVAAYAANAPTSPENARALWSGGQVGHATLRQVWLGPDWFVAGRAVSDALKIAAHEAFHLLQYEVIGQRAMSVSSLDQVPQAGPWWLLEGAAEYFAYLAVVAEGSITIGNVRAQWTSSARASTATLVALSTLRGQRETPRPYDVYALATELLLRDRDPKLTFTYLEAIARGVEWHEAFATTFGRTFEAFVAEFESYRRS